MLVVRWTRLPYFCGGRLPGTRELSAFGAVPTAWAARRPRRGHSPPGRPRRPTHATNSLSTLERSLNLLPGYVRPRGRPAARRYAHSCVPRRLASKPATRGLQNSWRKHFGGPNATPTRRDDNERHSLTLRRQHGRRGDARPNLAEHATDNGRRRTLVPGDAQTGLRVAPQLGRACLVRLALPTPPATEPMFYLCSGCRANIDLQLVASRAQLRRKRGLGKYPQASDY